MSILGDPPPAKRGRARSRSRILTAVVLGSWIGCSFVPGPLPDPGQRLRAARARAEEAGFEPLRSADETGDEPAGLEGERLPIAAWFRAGDANAGVHVYIEGDGLAWRSRHRVSRDPTPIDPIGLALAIADPSRANVVYLGRPCQYGFAGSRACRPLLWTAARFGEEGVEAMDQRLSRLLVRLGLEAEPLHLIGYSGGGVVAALVAARRISRNPAAADMPGIRMAERRLDQLITIAAPLDIETWTRLAGVSPLAASLSPMDSVGCLRRIRQHHFAGRRDRAVPLGAITPFLRALGTDAPARLEVVEDMDHRSWPGRWKEIVMRTRLFETPGRPASATRPPSRPGRESAQRIPDDGQRWAPADG